jgi:hypothetical protein
VVFLQVTPEIQRELLNSRNRGQKDDSNALASNILQFHSTLSLMLFLLLFVTYALEKCFRASILSDVSKETQASIFIVSLCFILSSSSTYSRSTDVMLVELSGYYFWDP